MDGWRLSFHTLGLDGQAQGTLFDPLGYFMMRMGYWGSEDKDSFKAYNQLSVLLSREDRVHRRNESSIRSIQVEVT